MDSVYCTARLNKPPVRVSDSIWVGTFDMEALEPAGGGGVIWNTKSSTFSVYLLTSETSYIL